MVENVFHHNKTNADLRCSKIMEYALAGRKN